MATVTMIPARPTVGPRKKTEDAPKLRVAAYCRVSTETDEQATSYDAQIEHYTDYIEKHPVYEDHLDFEFKSGLETEVQM